MIINQELCIQCKMCIPYCPVQAIEARVDCVDINEEACVECNGCIRAGVCPVDAFYANELSWPRSLRNSFSDPLGIHESTQHKGRGTEEVKTNDVTDLVVPGQVGIALEVGRPGVGAYFTDVEILIMAIAHLPYIEFAEKNPVTGFITDMSTGKLREDILGEKVLSAIIEFVIPEEKTEEVMKIIKEAAKKIDSVFSAVAFYAVGPNGEAPGPEVFANLGYKVSPAGKTNLGLGRKLALEGEEA